MKPGSQVTCRIKDLTPGDRIVLGSPPTGLRYDTQQDGYWTETEFIVVDTEHVLRRYPEFDLGGCILIVSAGGRLYKLEAAGNAENVTVILPQEPQ